jgi:uncharacterized membrane protein
MSLPAPGANRPESTCIWFAKGALALAVSAVTVQVVKEWLPLTTPYMRNLAAGWGSLVLLTFAAGCLVVYWSRRSICRPFTDISKHTAYLALSVGILLYTFGLSVLSLIRHNALFTGLWDLGYYAQLTWKLAHFEAPRSSLWHDALWGTHATLILAAAAPILWLFPTPDALLVFQSLLLAGGAIPSYFLGARLLGGPLGGLTAATAYLLYPPLQFLNLFDFHPDAFTVPLLLAAFAALFSRRIGWAITWAALLVFVKEDMALLALGFGLYAALCHKRREGYYLAAGTAAAFSLLVWVIVPNWSGHSYFAPFNRWQRFGDTPFALLIAPITNPKIFFGSLVQVERLGYLLLLITPLGGLPLLAPEVLMVGLPTLVSNFFSDVEAQYTIRSHYTAGLTPVMLTAAMVGGRRAVAWLTRRALSPNALLAGLSVTALFSSLFFSPMPWSQDASARKHFWSAFARSGLSGIGRLIPPEVSLSSANHLGAHFSFRKEIHLFPIGMDSTDLVLVDVAGLDYVGASLNSAEFSKLLRQIVTTRPLIASLDGLALFGRGAPSGTTPRRLVNLRPQANLEGRQSGLLSFGETAVFPHRLAPRETIRIHYTWSLTQPISGQPCIEEALVSSEGRVAWKRRRVFFHGLLPGGEWPPRWVTDERVTATIPETTPPGTYRWTVTTWDQGGLKPCFAPQSKQRRATVAEVHILPW